MTHPRRLLAFFAAVSLCAAPHAQTPTTNAGAGVGQSTAPTYGDGYAKDDKATAATEPDHVTTSGIVSATGEAFTSCFKWQPKGVCFWLVCTYYECHLDETVRIEHYTPDVVFSVWHDPKTHPWSDYGRKLAQKLDGAGNWLTGNLPIGTKSATITAVDSAGTKSTVRSHGDARNFNYRGVDAIGNPFNYIQGALTDNYGMSSNSPSDVPIPLPLELYQWFEEFPNNVAKHWAAVPAAYSGDRTTYARYQNSESTNTLGLSSGSIGGTAAKLMGAYTSMSNTLTQGGSVSLGNTGGTGSSDGSGTGSSGSGGSSGSSGGVSTSGSSGGSGSNNGNVGTATGGTDYLCPPSIAGFGLAFQSDLDTWFWRGMVPLESVYPEPWLPGMREIGSGALQTWGSVWPRQGTIFQPHPLKAAAVAAQRAGDIISYKAQPHIYTPLQLDTDKNYKFFGFQGIREHDKKHTLWQRVFPKPQKTCAVFGDDDSSVFPAGFGDGHNLGSRGSVWTAWRRQDCCIKPNSGVGFFLFSMPPGEDW